MRAWIVATGIFILALVIRLTNLGGFVTIDEPRWLERSRWFMTGLLSADSACPPVEWGREFVTHGWGCTFQIGYPGVTTMWGGSLGLWLHYWQTARPLGLDFRTFLETLPIHPAIDPAVITPMRLPFVVMGALFVPLFYLLLRRLLTEQVALGAALLVALHPFQIGLSRIIHHDRLNTMFMVLSSLMLIGYWLRGWPWYWLPLSALMAGLALLSKQVSWLILPYGAVLGGLSIYYHWQSRCWQGWTELWRWIGVGVVWGLITGVTFVVLFPAMWVMPGEVIETIFGQSLKLAEAGQPHYFLGQITHNPGWLFYPIGWLLRATPLEVVGLLGAVAAGVAFGRVRPLRQQVTQRPVETALALFVGLLCLFVTAADKKLVRYFLPAFPIIDIFAVMGLFWLFERLPRLNRRWRVSLVTGTILLSQGWLVLAHYPYYFTYYNPLTGGTRGAVQVMTLEGWGEGLNEAAAYLNQKPDAESLRVVVEMWCTTFNPFYTGRVNCLNSNTGGILRADYLVYYYNVIQRDLQWMEQWRYFEKHYVPEHRVTLHGLDYVLIFHNLIQHQVDRKANSLPGIFTTFGYNLTAEGRLTLFWQNLGLGRRLLSVGLAATPGAYPADRLVANASVRRYWLACPPSPAFEAELEVRKAIIESQCSLAAANLPPGLYDVQLGLRDSLGTSPLANSLLGVILVKENGEFLPVELK